MYSNCCKSSEQCESTITYKSENGKNKDDCLEFKNICA